jgi:hypothetical protein
VRLGAAPSQTSGLRADQFRPLREVPAHGRVSARATRRTSLEPGCDLRHSCLRSRARLADCTRSSSRAHAARLTALVGTVLPCPSSSSYHQRRSAERMGVALGVPSGQHACGVIGVAQGRLEVRLSVGRGWVASRGVVVRWRLGLRRRFWLAGGRVGPNQLHAGVVGRASPR